MPNFRKRIGCEDPGIKTSPQTGQLITSSGNLSMDIILGGGLPLGSICLIEEDKFVTHSKVLAKYFLAEGVMCQQEIFLGSLDDDPAELIKKLPRPLNNEELKDEQAEEAAEFKNNIDVAAGDAANNQAKGLRIAWRYNDLPVVNCEPASVTIGHSYNLMEPMNPMFIRSEKTLWRDCVNGNDSECGDNAFDNEETEEDEVADHVGNNINMEIGNSQSAEDTSLPPPPDDVQMQAEQSPIGLESSQCEHNNESIPMDLETCAGNSVNTDSTATNNNSTASNTQNTNAIFSNAKYASILQKLQPLLRQDKFSLGSINPTRPRYMMPTNLCRVCITSLGSPMWFDDNFSKDILKFLLILRALVRSARSVCFITMPMHLVAKLDETLIPKIRNLVDFAIELESFAGSERETNPAFRKYSGLLHLRKITAINSLIAYMPETTDLAFNLRRKKFVIEKLHLPPELQENNSDSSSSPHKASMSCSTANTPLLAEAGSNSKLAAASLDF